MRAIQKKVIVLADMPPPVQGISLVSAWVVQTLEIQGVAHVVFNTSVNQGQFYWVRRIHKFLSAGLRVMFEHRSQILYVSLSHGQSLYLQTLVISLARIRKFRIIVHHHTYLPIKGGNKFIYRLCHGFLRNYAEHIFLSEMMRDDYEKYWRPQGKRWVVTNNAVAVSRFIDNPNQNLNYRKIKYIFFSKISNEKGFKHIESISREILDIDDSTSFTIMGPTDDITIQDKIAQLKNDFPRQITYIGEYSEDELYKELSDSMFFLFPSEYKNEAAPLVVLEAQALGKICITSNIGSLASQVLEPGVAVEVKNWGIEVHRLHTIAQLSPEFIAESAFQIVKQTNRLALKAESDLKIIFREG